jgi:type II secretory pathway component GspD/PulD (secretin)
MTRCFFVTLNSHLILAVPDDKTNQAYFERLNTEALVVPNLAAANPQDRSSLVELLTSVFGVAHPSLVGDTAVVRASPEDLYAIRKTLNALYQPEPQVLLDVKTYLISRTHNRNTGVQLPRKVVIFNVYSEAESLISSNSSIVQELIQAGLVTAGDTLGIAELLVAEGYAGNSVLGTSSVYFGGGKTATGVQFDSVSGNASLSVSSVKELQDARVHLINGQSGTLKVGERYPILTSTTSSLGSSSKSSTTPTIQYEDLGLTLEAKPQVLANKEVLVHLHETIRSLAGISLNNIPILDNQDISTDLSIPDGVTTVLVSNLTRSETLATQRSRLSSPPSTPWRGC